jgi:HEAT repeat protein
LGQQNGDGHARRCTEDVAVVEAWREALRLCVTICSDDDIDRVLHAIVVPGPSEKADTARARAILGVLCLADEPNARTKAVDQVIDTFVRVIEDRDRYGHHSPSGVGVAAMELASTRWGPALRSALVHAFCERNVGQGNVGALLGMVVGEPPLRDSTRFESWLRQQIETLQIAGELEAVEAALGIMSAAFQGMDTNVPDLADALLKRLTESAAMAHAAAWALGWMNGKGRTERSPEAIWHPAAAQIQQLVAFVSNLAADPDAVRFVCWILRAEKTTETTALLIVWLRHSLPDLRSTVAETLGTLGSEAAVRPLIDRLVDTEMNVRRAAANALGKIGSEAAVQPLIDQLADTAGYVRGAAATALGKIGSEAAIQACMDLLGDPDEGMRQATLRLLAERGSREESILLSRDLDGLDPFIDPQAPILDAHVSRAAAALGLTLEDTRARYEALASQYRLTLAWRPRGA